MIVNNISSGEVKSSHNIAGTALTMKATGKGFKALIDSLYRDKAGSIVRELGANALDAHKVAGTEDKPFEIHLPDSYEPYISFRDYGCSMSPDHIKKIYGTIFESTKDNSQDQIGGYGLGGKNFLSYQDSGTIIAYLDGIKYDYVLMYNEYGIPNIHEMGTSETEEPNGIYIEIAVKQNDYKLFANAVIEQLRWLKVKPILHNNAFKVQFDDISFDKEYGKFKTYKYSSRLNGFWIVQGEIGYPVDLDEVSNLISDKTALAFFKCFKNGVFFFDIGEIFVTLSRENIQYDSHTIASIENCIKTLAPEISKDIADEVNSKETVWDKIVLLNSNPVKAMLFSLCNIDLDDLVDPSCKIIHVSGKMGFNIPNSKIEKCLVSDISSGRRKYMKNVNERYIFPSKDTVVYLRDKGHNGIASVKNDPTYYPTKFLIEHEHGHECVDSNFESTISKLLGGYKVKRVSTLPVPPKTVSARNGSPVAYLWDTVCSINNLYDWERIYDEDELENGYYVEFEKYPDITVGGNYNLLTYILNDKSVFDKSTFNLYAIKTSKINLVKDNPNFKNIVEVLDEANKNMERSFGSTIKTKAKNYWAAKKLYTETCNLMKNLKLHMVTAADLSKLQNNSDVIKCIVKVNKLSEKYFKNIEKKYLDLTSYKGLYLKEQFNKYMDSDDHKIILDKINKKHNLNKFVESKYALKWITASYYYINPQLSKEISNYLTENKEI